MSRVLKLIIRLLNTDLDGTIKVPYALARVKGIGVNLGFAIARVAGVDPDLRIGMLSDKQLDKLEQVARNPEAAGIPAWMLNRRSDPATGRNLHITGADMDLAIKEDIQTMIRTRSWKGVRHSLGLKVRGQRTRTTGRKGMTVGVSKRAQIQQQAEKKEESAKR